MEKYSKHLETIVAERTQDLLQEKQKTDLLLYSMEVYMADESELSIIIFFFRQEKKKNFQGMNVQMVPPTGHLKNLCCDCFQLEMFGLFINKLYIYMIMFVSGMLPKQVADDLRQGCTAEAQSYSNATVYFR